MNNQWISKVAMWLVLIVVLFTVFKQFDTSGGGNAQQKPYSDFISMVQNHQIQQAEIQETGAGGVEIVATTTDGAKVRTTGTFFDRGLIDDLINSNVKFNIKEREQRSLLGSILISWGPMLLLIAVWVYFMRQMQGGGKGGAFSFGKSKARMLDDSNNTVTFADVAGADEAKEEVKEVVDFLKDPQKFQRLGGRIPRGLLLVGPPGTGKTLLAKSIAGEAKVPFFSISGSDFVEMFVGVGAARVRDMFENAKKNAPCIIFIDEIDAVGRQRGAGLGGGNDEREQTLNQMLVEMDGFETNMGVIVVAATNRPDILDAALLRPGRFDRQVYVTLPDVKGREQILTVHMRKIPVGQDVNPNVIARGTPGMSGADLANLCNEAALMAARRNARVVEMQDFEQAKDKIFMGPERRSAVMDPEELKNTAYHEAGHALIGRLMPKSDPVHKVTIVPRGRALGVTFTLPEKDRYGYDKEWALSRISMLFGGRIAEEVFMNQMTTGASDDFNKATQLARDMVTRYGMSDELGPMVYAENEGEVFLGRSVTKTTNVSEATMQKVDIEVRRIIDEQYALARRLIEENKDKMHAMAKAMLEWETIDSSQLDEIMAGKEPTPPKDWVPKHPAAGGGGNDSGGDSSSVQRDPSPSAA
ncbi:ATP-dependent metallopeptidase FtsH/Yme1/Tma family protein [Lampropedia aestuarii]|uniref:ATP-dependent zinc metalloprotease FtsH n=1 Tax=Lampropedia aestuarii TaxID=2562762 RepID=A0A4S5BIM2_9BURK|nr:ATP-dependent zinc metalloprotease FtsH [Lampropedia aestuarii]MDH5857120.1 ATP-dependent zinc metalloprotease FtsH [Lampropedia aestuarii]THJ32267.1 ATP-dependent metallopeptidase FtsH/Yme1/Tma family protein [Lampropedia aestuarii]